MLAGARVVFVGETHDSPQSHAAEVEILRGLNRRFPGQVALGLEMFRQPQQPLLNRWVQGELSEAEFVEATQWKRTWGFDFALYRPILELARTEHLDLIALNPPEEVQRKVREHSFEELSAEERAGLPQLGEVDPAQRALLKAIYEAHAAHGKGFDGFLRVQLLWEESMAERAAAYLGDPANAAKRLVTLTGDLHVSYGLGLPKKLLRRLPMPYAIVLAEGMDTEAEMDVHLPSMALPPADFLWRPSAAP
jgi:uncharacterized iron-regulated protein